MPCQQKKVLVVLIINCVLLSDVQGCAAHSLSLSKSIDYSFPWLSLVRHIQQFHVYGPVVKHINFITICSTHTRNTVSKISLATTLHLLLGFYVISADVDSADDKIYICFSNVWPLPQSPALLSIVRQIN